jgi:hypothetical protein
MLIVNAINKLWFKYKYNKLNYRKQINKIRLV